jgi:hypothetical protein
MEDKFSDHLLIDRILGKNSRNDALTSPIVGLHFFYMINIGRNFLENFRVLEVYNKKAAILKSLVVKSLAGIRGRIRMLELNDGSCRYRPTHCRKDFDAFNLTKLTKKRIELSLRLVKWIWKLHDIEVAVFLVDFESLHLT